MARSVLPTAIELAALTDVAAVRRWAGASDLAWTAFDSGLARAPSLLVLAGLAQSAFSDILCLVRIIPPAAGGGAAPDPRELNAVEAI